MSIINRLAINAVSIYSARAFEAVLQLALLPFILSQVGRKYYAAAVLIMSIQATVDLARGGMQKATIKYVSEYTAKKDYKTANGILASSSAMQGGIGACGLLACLILSLFTATVFALPVYMESEARWATVLLGLGIALSFALSPWQNSVAAHERYDLISLARVSGKLFRAVLVVTFLLCHAPALITLVAAQIAGDIFERLLCFLFLKKINQQLKLILRNISANYIKILVKFSFFDFFQTLSSLLYLQGSLYLATHLISLDAVAALGIIGNITSLVIMLMSQVAQMLVPLASRLQATGNKETLKSLVVQSTNITVFVGGVLMTGLLPWMGSLLSLWLGDSYVYFTEAAIVMLVATYLVNSVSCLHTSMGGIGKVAADGISSVLCTIAGLIIGVGLIYFTNTSLMGLVIGLFCARFFRFIFTSWYGSKMFEILYIKFMKTAYLRAYILIALISLSGLLIENTFNSWTVLIIAGITTSSLYILAGWFWILDVTIRLRIKSTFFNSISVLKNNLSKLLRLDS